MNEEPEFDETANELHDGDRSIVAYTVVFTAAYDEDLSLSTSFLMIKDITGVEPPILAPSGCWSCPSFPAFSSQLNPFGSFWIRGRTFCG